MKYCAILVLLSVAGCSSLSRFDDEPPPVPQPAAHNPQVAPPNAMSAPRAYEHWHEKNAR